MSGWSRVALLAALCGAGCGRLGFDDIDTSSPDGGGNGVRFSELCGLTEHVVITNGIGVDDAVGARLSAALELGCETAVSRRSVSQEDASAVDANGRPLTPSRELILLGGGDGPHRVVRYLLAGDTPLVWGGVAPVSITERSSGRVVAMGNTSPSFDFIMLQVIREPLGETIALSAQGLQENGTLAAALYFEDMVAPRLAEQPFTWLVVRWADTDDVQGPTADDDFTIVESG